MAGQISMRAVLATVCVCALLGGCNNAPPTVDASSGAPTQVQPMVELVAKSRPIVPDVPIPVGFDLDQDKSRSFSAAGARYIDHVYKGSDGKFSVARFYKRQMPIHRWTLVTDMFVQGDIMLDFEKETERCRVVITDGGLFNSTTVKVQLWTSGRISAPSGSAGKD